MEDRYGLSASFDFNSGSSLSGLSQVSESVRGLINALEQLADISTDSSREFDRSMKGIRPQQVQKVAKQTNVLGDSLKKVRKEISPLKDEFKALRAESRNIEFGDIGDPKQFQAGVKELKKYTSELERLERQIKGTTTVEREFAAAIKSQKRSSEVKMTSAKSSRAAFVAAERRGISESAQTVGRVAVTPLNDFAKTGIELFAAFDDKLAAVKSVTAPTEKQFASLRQKAADLGASTRYTASEAADAMKLLGMAGFSINSIMVGVSDSLSLASAGELSLGDAADISTKALAGFGLQVKEMSHLTDVLARTANTTNSGIQDLGIAMSYAAPNAKIFGASLEETAALIGVMSNAGIAGDKAGTALRGAFLRLANAPKQGKAALEALDIQVSDVDTGKMRDIVDLLDEVRMKLGVNAKDLSESSQFLEAAAANGESVDEAVEALLKRGDRQADQISKLKDIFGTTAVSGIASAIDQLSEAKSVILSDMAASFDDQTIKETVASITQNNAKFSKLTDLMRSGRSEDREQFAKLDIFQYIADNSDSYKQAVDIINQATQSVSSATAAKLGGSNLAKVKSFMEVQKGEDKDFGKRFADVDFSQIESGAELFKLLEDRSAQAKDATLDLTTALKANGIAFKELTGAGKRTADVMEDSLAGDFRALSSAAESVYINLIEPLRPAIRAVVKAITSLGLAISNLPVGLRTLIAGVGLLVSAFAGLLLAGGSVGVLLFGFQQAAATATLAMTAIEHSVLPLTGFYEAAMLAAAGTNPFNTQLKTLKIVANSAIAPLGRLGLALRTFGMGALAAVTSPMGLTILGLGALFFALDALTPQVNLLGIILGAVAAPFGFFWGLLKGIVGGIWDLVAPLLSAGAAVVGFPIGSIAAGFSEALEAFSHFVTTGESLGRRLVSVLSTPLVFAAERIAGLWDRTIGFLIDRLSFFGNFARRIGKFLISGLAENSPGPTFQIREKWTNTIEYLKELIGKWISWVRGIGQGIAGGLTGGLGAAAGGILAVLSLPFNYIKSRIEATSDYLQEKFAFSDQLKAVLNEPINFELNRASFEASVGKITTVLTYIGKTLLPGIFETVLTGAFAYANFVETGLAAAFSGIKSEDMMKADKSNNVGEIILYRLNLLGAKNQEIVDAFDRSKQERELALNNALVLSTNGLERWVAKLKFYLGSALDALVFAVRYTGVMIASIFTGFYIVSKSAQRSLSLLVRFVIKTFTGAILLAGSFFYSIYFGITRTVDAIGAMLDTLNISPWLRKQRDAIVDAFSIKFDANGMVDRVATVKNSFEAIKTVIQNMADPFIYIGQLVFSLTDKLKENINFFNLLVLIASTMPLGLFGAGFAGLAPALVTGDFLASLKPIYVALGKMLPAAVGTVLAAGIGTAIIDGVRSVALGLIVGIKNAIGTVLDWYEIVDRATFEQAVSGLLVDLSGLWGGIKAVQDQLTELVTAEIGQDLIDATQEFATRMSKAFEVVDAGVRAIYGVLSTDLVGGISLVDLLGIDLAIKATQGLVGFFQTGEFKSVIWGVSTLASGLGEVAKGMLGIAASSSKGLFTAFASTFEVFFAPIAAGLDMLRNRIVDFVRVYMPGLYNFVVVISKQIAAAGSLAAAEAEVIAKEAFSWTMLAVKYLSKLPWGEQILVPLFLMLAKIRKAYSVTLQFLKDAPYEVIGNFIKSFPLSEWLAEWGQLGSGILKIFSVLRGVFGYFGVDVARDIGVLVNLLLNFERIYRSTTGFLEKGVKAITPLDLILGSSKGYDSEAEGILLKKLKVLMGRPELRVMTVDKAIEAMGWVQKVRFLMPALLSYVGGVSLIAIGMYPVLKTLFRYLLDYVFTWGFVRDLIILVGRAINGLLSATGNLVGALLSHIPIIGGLFRTHWIDPVTKAEKTWWDMITGIPSSIVDAFKNFDLGKFLRGGFDFLLSIPGRIVDTVKWAISEILRLPQTIAQMANDFGDAFKDVLASVAAGLVVIYFLMKMFGKDTMNILTSMFKGIFSPFISVASFLGGVFKTILSPFVLIGRALSRNRVEQDKYNTSVEKMNVGLSRNRGPVAGAVLGPVASLMSKTPLGKNVQRYGEHLLPQKEQGISRRIELNLLDEKVRRRAEKSLKMSRVAGQGEKQLIGSKRKFSEGQIEAEMRKIYQDKGQMAAAAWQVSQSGTAKTMTEDRLRAEAHKDLAQKGVKGEGLLGRHTDLQVIEAMENIRSNAERMSKIGIGANFEKWSTDMSSAGTEVLKSLGDAETRERFVAGEDLYTQDMIVQAKQVDLHVARLGSEIQQQTNYQTPISSIEAAVRTLVRYEATRPQGLKEGITADRVIGALREGTSKNNRNNYELPTDEVGFGRTAIPSSAGLGVLKSYLTRTPDLAELGNQLGPGRSLGRMFQRNDGLEASLNSDPGSTDFDLALAKSVQRVAQLQELVRNMEGKDDSLPLIPKIADISTIRQTIKDGGMQPENAYIYDPDEVTKFLHQEYQGRRAGSAAQFAMEHGSQFAPGHTIFEGQKIDENRSSAIGDLELAQAALIDRIEQLLISTDAGAGISKQRSFDPGVHATMMVLKQLDFHGFAQVLNEAQGISAASEAAWVNGSGIMFRGKENTNSQDLLDLKSGTADLAREMRREGTSIVQVLRDLSSNAFSEQDLMNLIDDPGAIRGSDPRINAVLDAFDRAGSEPSERGRLLASISGIDPINAAGEAKDVHQVLAEFSSIRPQIHEAIMDYAHDIFPESQEVEQIFKSVLGTLGGGNRIDFASLVPQPIKKGKWRPAKMLGVQTPIPQFVRPTDAEYKQDLISQRRSTLGASLYPEAKGNQRDRTLGVFAETMRTTLADKNASADSAKFIGKLSNQIVKSFAIDKDNYAAVIPELGVDGGTEVIANIKKELDELKAKSGTAEPSKADVTTAIRTNVTDWLAKETFTRNGMDSVVKGGNGADKASTSLSAMIGTNTGLIELLKKPERKAQFIQQLEQAELAGSNNSLMGGLSKSLPRDDRESLTAYKRRLEQTVANIQRGSFDQLSAEVLIAISQATKKNIAQLIQPDLFPKMSKADAVKANSLRQAAISERIASKGYGNMQQFQGKAQKRGVKITPDIKRNLFRGDFHKIDMDQAIQLSEMLSKTGKRGAEAYVEVSAEFAAQSLLGRAARANAQGLRRSANARSRLTVQLDLTSQYLQEQAKTEMTKRESLGANKNRSKNLQLLALSKVGKDFDPSNETGLPGFGSGVGFTATQLLSKKNTGAAANLNQLFALMNDDSANPEQGIFKDKMDKLVAGIHDPGEKAVWDSITRTLNLTLTQIRDLHKLDMQAYIPAYNEAEALYKELEKRGNIKYTPPKVIKANAELKRSRIKGLLALQLPGRRVIENTDNRDVRSLVGDNVSNLMKKEGIDTKAMGLSGGKGNVANLYHAIAASTGASVDIIVDKLAAFDPSKVVVTDKNRAQLEKFQPRLAQITKSLEADRAAGKTNYTNLANLQELLQVFAQPEAQEGLQEALGEINYKNLSQIAKGDTPIDLARTHPQIFGNLGQSDDYTGGLPDLNSSANQANGFTQALVQLKQLTGKRALHNKQVMEIQKDLQAGKFDLGKLESAKSIFQGEGTSKTLTDFDKALRERVTQGGFDATAQQQFAADSSNKKFFHSNAAVDQRASNLRKQLGKGDIDQKTHKQVMTTIDDIGRNGVVFNATENEYQDVDKDRIEELRTKFEGLKGFFSGQELISQLGGLSAASLDRIGVGLEAEYSKIYLELQNSASGIELPDQLISALGSFRDGKNSAQVSALIEKIVTTEGLTLDRLTKNEQELLTALSDHFDVNVKMMLDLQKVPRNIVGRIWNSPQAAWKTIKKEYAGYQDSLRLSLGGFSQSSGMDYDQIASFLKVQGLNTEQIYKMFARPQRAIAGKNKAKFKAQKQMSFISTDVLGESNKEAMERIDRISQVKDRTSGEKVTIFMAEIEAAMKKQGKSQPTIDKAMARFKHGNRALTGLDNDLGLQEYLNIQTDQLESIAQLFGVEAKLLDSNYSSRGAIAQTLAYSLDLLKRTFDPAAITSFLGGLLAGTSFGDKLTGISKGMVARRKGAMQPLGERFVASIQRNVVNPILGSLVRRFNGQTMAVLDLTTGLAGNFAEVLNKYFLGRIPGIGKIQQSLLGLESRLLAKRSKVSSDLENFSGIAKRAKEIYDGSFLKPVVEFFTNRQAADGSWIDSVKSLGSTIQGGIEAWQSGSEDALLTFMAGLGKKTLDVAAKNPISRFLKAQTANLGRMLITSGQKRRSRVEASQVFSGERDADGSRQTIDELRAPFATFQILLGNFLLRKVARPLKTGSEALISFSQMALKGIDHLDALLEKDLPGKISGVYASIRKTLATKVLGTINDLKADISNNQGQTKLQKLRLTIYSTLVRTIEAVVDIFKQVESSVKGGLSGLIGKALGLLRGLFTGLGDFLSRFRKNPAQELKALPPGRSGLRQPTPEAAGKSVSQRRQELLTKLSNEGRIDARRVERNELFFGPTPGAKGLGTPLSGASPSVQISPDHVDQVLGATMTPPISEVKAEQQQIIDAMDNVNQKIEQNWDGTSTHVVKNLRYMVLVAEKLGYWIQRYISEGSPGPTERIRGFYDKTTRHLIGRFGEMVSGAQRAGKQIEAGLAGKILSELPPAAVVGQEVRANNRSRRKRGSSDANAASIVDATIAGLDSEQAAAPAMAQAATSATAAAHAVKEVRTEATGTAAAVAEIADSEQQAVKQASKLSRLFGSMPPILGALNTGSSVKMTMKSLAVAGGGLAATGFAFQNIINTSGQMGLVSQSTSESMSNLFQIFTTIGSVGTILGGVFTALTGGLSALFGIGLSIVSLVFSPMALTIGAIVLGVTALILGLNALSKSFFGWDFIGAGVKSLGDGFQAATATGRQLAGTIESKIAPAGYKLTVGTINPLRYALGSALGSDTVNWLQGAWDSGTGMIKGSIDSLVPAAVAAGQGTINALNHNPTVRIPEAWEEAKVKIFKTYSSLVDRAKAAATRISNWLFPTKNPPAPTPTVEPTKPATKTGTSISGKQVFDAAFGGASVVSTVGMLGGFKKISALILRLRVKAKDFFTYFTNKRNLIGLRRFGAFFKGAGNAAGGKAGSTGKAFQAAKGPFAVVGRFMAGIGKEVKLFGQFLWMLAKPLRWAAAGIGMMLDAASVFGTLALGPQIAIVAAGVGLLVLALTNWDTLMTMTKLAIEGLAQTFVFLLNVISVGIKGLFSGAQTLAGWVGGMFGGGKKNDEIAAPATGNAAQIVAAQPANQSAIEKVRSSRQDSFQLEDALRSGEFSATDRLFGQTATGDKLSAGKRIFGSQDTREKRSLTIEERFSGKNNQTGQDISAWDRINPFSDAVDRGKSRKFSAAEATAVSGGNTSMAMAQAVLTANEIALAFTSIVLPKLFAGLAALDAGEDPSAQPSGTQPAGGGLMGGLAAAWNGAGSLIGGTVSAMGSAINWIQGAWATGTEAINGSMNSMVPTAELVGQGTINALNHSPTVRIPEAWEEARVGIQGSMNSLVPTANGVATEVKGFFNGAFSEIAPLTVEASVVTAKSMTSGLRAKAAQPENTKGSAALAGQADQINILIARYELLGTEYDKINNPKGLKVVTGFWGKLTGATKKQSATIVGERAEIAKTLTVLNTQANKELSSSLINKGMGMFGDVAKEAALAAGQAQSGMINIAAQIDSQAEPIRSAWGDVWSYLEANGLSDGASAIAAHSLYEIGNGFSTLGLAFGNFGSDATAAIMNMDFPALIDASKMFVSTLGSGLVQIASGFKDAAFGAFVFGSFGFASIFSLTTVLAIVAISLILLTWRFGNIKEIIKGVAKVAVSSFQGLKAVFSGLFDMGGGVIDVFKGIKGALKGDFSGISAGVDRIKAAWVKMIADVKLANEGIVEGFSMIGSGFQGVIDKAIVPVYNWIVDTFTKAFEQVKSNIAAASTDLKGYFREVGEYWGEVFTFWADIAKAEISKTITNIQAELPRIKSILGRSIEEIGLAFQDLGAPLKFVAEELLFGFGSAIGSIQVEVKNLVGIAKTTGTELVAAFGSAFGLIKDSALAFWAAFKTEGISGVVAILPEISSKFSAAAGKIVEIAGKLGGELSAPLTRIKDAFGRLGEDAQWAIGTAFDAIADTGKRLWLSLTEIFSGNSVFAGALSFDKELVLVQTGFKQVETLWQRTITKLTEIARGLGSFLQPVYAGMLGGFETTWTQIQLAASKAIEAMTAQFPTLIKAWESMVSFISAIWTEKVEPIWAATASAVERLMVRFPALARAVEVGAETIEMLGGSTVKFLKAGIEPITELLDKFGLLDVVIRSVSNPVAALSDGIAALKSIGSGLFSTELVTIGALNGEVTSLALGGTSMGTQVANALQFVQAEMIPLIASAGQLSFELSTNLAGPVMEAIKRIAPAFMAFGVDLLKLAANIAAGFVEAGWEIGKALLPVIREVIDLIGNVGQAIVKDIPAIISEIAKIFTTYREMITNIKGVFGDTFRNVLEIAGRMWTAFKAEGMGAAMEVAQEIPVALSAGVEAVKALFQDGFKEIWNHVKGTGDKFGELGERFKAIFENLVELVKTGFHAIKTIFSEVIDLVKSFGSSFADLKTSGTELVSALTTSFTEIKNVVGGVFSMFRQGSKEAGEEMADGLGAPAEQAASRWGRTGAFISNLMGNLRQESADTGQEILHNLAENSPGPTERIRQLYSFTTGFVTDRFGELEQAAQSTGKEISRRFGQAAEITQAHFAQVSAPGTPLDTPATPPSRAERAGKVVSTIQDGVEGVGNILQLVGLGDLAEPIQMASVALSILGTVLTSFQLIVTAATTVWSWFTAALSAPLMAILVPLLPIILAIGVAVGLLYWAFQSNFLGFGDAVRTVFDVIWGFLTALWDGIAGVWSGIFGQIGTQIDNIGKTFKGAIDFLLSPFVFLFNITMNLLRQFGLVGQATSGLAAPIKFLVDMLLLPFRIIGMVVEFIIRVIGWLIQAVVVVGTLLLAVLLAPLFAVVGVLILIVSLIMMLVNTIKFAFGAVYAFLSFPLNVLTFLARMIFWLFQTVLFAFGQEFASIFGGIWSEIVTAFSEIGQTLGFVFDLLITPFKMMFDYLKAGWESIFGTISGGAGSFNPLIAAVKVALFPLIAFAFVLKWIIKGIALMIKGLVLVGGVIAAVFLTPIYLIAHVFTSIIGTVLLLGKFLLDIGKMIVQTLIAPFQAVAGFFGGIGNFFSGKPGEATTSTAPTTATQAYAVGGYVSGPGTGTSDSIKARLSNGEFVINAASTRLNRPFLELINAGVPAEQAIRTLSVAHPASELPTSSELAAATKTGGDQGGDRHIEIHLHFGDIVLNSPSGKEAATEFVQSLQDPEVEAAIIRVIRNQVESLR